MPEDDSKLPPAIPRLFYTILLAAGIVLYVSWALLYGVVLDVGLYAICAVLIGFGLTGMLLYSQLEKEAQQAEKD
ncbi:MAG: hypothetical protein KAJ51_01625 [Thermoplasmata archaeon]|nr:hypothetical protein [Thermoplasmata archaeon]